MSDHEHDHDDEHDASSPQALRAEALESLLRDKGLLTAEAVDAIIRYHEQDIGPMNGARVVARAWTEAAYKQRLLDDGTAAIAELGFQGPQDRHIVVVENTDAVHNVVVCSLCSCYPWSVLGLPPSWYKEPAYRSRVVREPRVVLAEMGLQVPSGVEIRVWDSSAEIRYLVLPQRPAATDGLPADELAMWVTRDSMIGVGQPTPPRAKGASTSDA